MAPFFIPDAPEKGRVRAARSSRLSQLVLLASAKDLAEITQGGRGARARESCVSYGQRTSSPVFFLVPVFFFSFFAPERFVTYPRRPS